MTQTKQAKQDFNEIIDDRLRESIPNLIRLDKYLIKPAIIIISILLPILTIAGALATYIFKPYLGEILVLDALSRPGVESKLKKSILEALNESEVKKAVADMNNEAEDLNNKLKDTFEREVDSAQYKVLRFGCNKAGGTANQKLGIPSCKPGPVIQGMEKLPEFRSTEDSSILVITNTKTQRLKLEIGLPFESTNTDSLENLLIQITAEPAPNNIALDPALAEGRKTLNLSSLKTSTNPNQNAASFITDNNMIRLISPIDKMPLKIEIDITDTLRETKISGPILLRFHTYKNIKGDTTKEDGTTLFLLRTITSSYHLIPTLTNQQQNLP